MIKITSIHNNSKNNEIYIQSTRISSIQVDADTDTVAITVDGYGSFIYLKETLQEVLSLIKGAE